MRHFSIIFRSQEKFVANQNFLEGDSRGHGLTLTLLLANLVNTK